MFPFGGHGFGLALGPFEANYRCYPVTFIDKPEAETGDKIFLPPSALDRLCECLLPGRSTAGQRVSCDPMPPLPTPAMHARAHPHACP